MTLLRSLALSLLALGLSLSGGVKAQERELKIGITQFPSTFNPIIDSMLAKSYILAMTRRPIAGYNQDWELICFVCTKLPTMENGLAVQEKTADGKAGMAITYDIHPEATWGDGTPVTVEDVLFTWEVGKHPKSGVSGQEFFTRILAIDKIDDKHFTIHLDKVLFDYSSAGAFDLLPAHLERAIFEASPEEYKNRTTFDSNTGNPGLYFGPYRITQVVTGSHVVLEPNPTWYGGKPDFRSLTVRVIENTTALEANLLSGGIDMVAGELGFTIDQGLAFEKRHGDRFQVFYKSGLIYEHIDLNLDNPVLQDANLRKALLYALDRELISKQLFGGRQPVAESSVSPLDWVHSNDITHYPYDPDQAATLLDAAGWSEMRGGIRHNKAGDKLSLEIMTTAGNRSRELVEQVLQSQWRQLGIEVRIRNEPARVFFGETVTKRKFSHMAMFAWISAPESVPRTTLSAEGIPTEANNWAGQNYTGYSNPRMDALIDAIEVELDRPKRKALWQQLQALYTEDLPVLPLYWRANVYVLPKWLSGVRPTGHSGTTTLWVEEWRSEAE